MSGDIEMNHSTSIVSQYQEHMEHFKADCRHGKEIDGNQSLEVNVQKSAPGLRRRLAVPEHVLADAGFADVDAQLEQLTMDVGRAPERVLAAQAPDQITNLTGKAGPTGLPAAYFPRPEEAKALAMPSNHSLRFDDGQCRAPVAPDSAQNHPQEPVDNGYRDMDEWKKDIAWGFNRGRFFAVRCRTQIWCRSARISSSKAARDRNTDRTAASKGRIRSIKKGTTGRRLISNRSEFTIGTRSPRGVTRPQVDSVRVLNL